MVRRYLILFKITRTIQYKKEAQKMKNLRINSKLKMEKKIFKYNLNA